MLSDSARSISEAAALERELLDEYRFGRQQLVELCGHGSAVAVAKVLALGATSTDRLRGEAEVQGFVFRLTARQGRSGVLRLRWGKHLQGGAWALELQAWVP